MSESEELRAELERARSGGGTPRYGAALRERAVKLLTARQQGGETAWQVSEELGLPSQTLRRWERAAKGEPAFRRVAIEGGDAPRQSKPRLVLSCHGVQVTGLTVGELATLLRSLSS
jgi:hypothetical protein